MQNFELVQKFFSFKVLKQVKELVQNFFSYRKNIEYNFNFQEPKIDVINDAG